MVNLRHNTDKRVVSLHRELILLCCFIAACAVSAGLWPAPASAGPEPATANHRAALVFASQSKGNIFASAQGSLELRVSYTSAWVSGSVKVSDETGKVLNEYPVPANEAKFVVPLPAKGFYVLNAEVRVGDGLKLTASTTAAVLGEPMSDSERLNSHFGAWNVHGDMGLSSAAGSGWNRVMLPLKDYQLDQAGKIIAKPLALPLDKRFSWIGTLAFGLPPWIKGKPANSQSDTLFAPADWSQLSQLVQQFSRDLSEFPAVFELYNEPEAHWKGSVADLVRFDTTIAQAIKAEHPSTKVIGPCFTSIRVPQLQAMVQAGLLDHLDGISMHAYVKGSTPEQDFIGGVLQLKSYLKSIGKENFPIYLTEFGWSAGNWKDQQGTFFQPVDEITQAQYVSRAFTLLTDQEVNVAINFVLLYRTDADASPVNEGKNITAGFSMLHADQTPKPVYMAYSNVANWMNGATAPRWKKLSETTYLLVFNKNRKTIGVAWDTASNSGISFPNVASGIEDMMGRDVPSNAPIYVTQSPIFFELPSEVVANLNAKPDVKAKPGDVLDLGYEKVWLPAALQGHGNGGIAIPQDTKHGAYIVFAKGPTGIDVFRLQI